MEFGFGKLTIMNFKNYYCFLLSIVFWLFSTTICTSQNLELIIKAPKTAILNDICYIEYKIELPDTLFDKLKIDKFVPPQLNQYGNVYKPSKSTINHSFNGKISKSIIHRCPIVFNFIGTYTIPPATITLNDVSILSKSTQITILPEDKIDNSQLVSEIFVKPIILKDSIYYGDTLKIDYKLYVREKSFKTNDIDSINYSFFKLPTNDLYYKHEKIASSWELEHYNGINYHTLLIKRYNISPKRTGKIIFDKLEGILYTSKSNDETDIFEAFFDRKKRTIIKNNISSSQFRIFVKELKK